jgi:hypothetical protein
MPHETTRKRHRRDHLIKRPAVDGSFGADSFVQARAQPGPRPCHVRPDVPPDGQGGRPLADLPRLPRQGARAVFGRWRPSVLRLHRDHTLMAGMEPLNRRETSQLRQKSFSRTRATPSSSFEAVTYATTASTVGCAFATAKPRPASSASECRRHIAKRDPLVGNQPQLARHLRRLCRDPGQPGPELSSGDRRRQHRLRPLAAAHRRSSVPRDGTAPRDRTGDLQSHNLESEQ